MLKRNDFLNLLNSKNIKFLFAGTLNAIFGYFACLFIYDFLKEWMNTFFIGIICNIFVITFNYVTYKFIVFKSHGNILYEYLRCYIVYGMSSLTGTTVVYILVDYFNFKFYIALLIAMWISVLFSWVGHNKFTYRSFGGRR